METEPQNQDKPRRSGGWKSHRPGCKCYPCKARQRKEEALAFAARDGGVDFDALNPAQRKRAEREVALNADLPPIIATRKSQRQRVLEWLKIRHEEPELTNKEIAGRLGLKPNSLTSLLQRATKQGWLRFEDPVSRLENELIPKTIDNLSEFLDQKDKQVTIEMAKGTVFKAYQDSKGMTDGSTTVLALKIETAEPATAKVVTSHIVGKPKVIEVVKEESENEA